MNPAKMAKLDTITNSPKIRGTNSVELESQRKALPVYNARKRLINLIQKHDTLIIIGETGSGKTTQIPQYIYEEMLHRKKVIGVTQPRRVAATTLSARVAQEMSTTLGDIVGYSIRFEDVTSVHTKLKFLTDGMLLKEAVSDELLSMYSIIVLDEAHERTIHTDVLLGIVKKAQNVRNEKNMMPLKVLIMSATMDVDNFSEYFGGAPVVYMEGRQYSVQVFHTKQTQEDYIFSCLVTIFQIHQETPPNEDILVFLTGQEEIESMTVKVKSIAKGLGVMSAPLRVLPLFSSLPSKQVSDVFRPSPPGMRKVILSTNVAETSVTISGVKHVVDSGRVKARYHNPRTGLDLLRVQVISQAQAWQRTGRAGRESDGCCYRVYTQQEFDKMPKMTVPEILRCNLSSVCLQLLALGVDVLHFDFIDKPPLDALESALNELKLLGAVNSVDKPQLTAVGQQMAKFPIDPKYSKVILSAKDHGCVEEILSIIAVLSGESVLVQPLLKREEAREAQRKFLSSAGDHISLLNIFRNFRKVSQQKQWCGENFLQYRNLQYAVHVRKQLSEIVKRLQVPLSSCGEDMEKVRRCLLSGLFMNVAELQRDKQFVMLSTRQPVSIHPSSFLAGTLPHCVVFSEVVHTNKCYIKHLSIVDPDWLSEVDPTYFRRHRVGSAPLR